MKYKSKNDVETKLLKKKEKVLEKAIRIISIKLKNKPSSHLLEHVKILKFKDIFNYDKCIIFEHGQLNEKVPEGFSIFFATPTVFQP